MNDPRACHRGAVPVPGPTDPNVVDRYDYSAPFANAIPTMPTARRTNPALWAVLGQLGALDVLGLGYVIFQSLQDRLIFDQQLAFATAVRGDATREGQIKEALETVKAAELALEKAILLERNRDPFGAWESVELAAENWPDDPALNRRRADLAVRAAEFVSSMGFPTRGIRSPSSDLTLPSR